MISLCEDILIYNNLMTIERLAYEAVLRDDDMAVEAMCKFIDDPYNIIFETSLDLILTDMVDEIILEAKSKRPSNVEEIEDYIKTGNELEKKLHDIENKIESTSKRDPKLTKLKQERKRYKRKIKRVNEKVSENVRHRLRETEGYIKNMKKISELKNTINQIPSSDSRYNKVQNLMRQLQHNENIIRNSLGDQKHQLSDEEVIKKLHERMNKIKKDPLNSIWNPRLTKDEKAYAKYVGKEMKNKYLKDIPRLTRIDRPDPNMPKEGILHRTLSKVSRSKVGDTLARGIDKGLQHRFGDVLKKQLGKGGMYLAKKMMKTGGKKYVKALDDIERYGELEAQDKIKHDKGGEKEKIRQKLAQGSSIASILPLAYSPVGPKYINPMLTGASAVAGGVSSMLDPTHYGKSKTAQSAAVRGAERVRMGKKLYRKFKKLRDSGRKRRRR